MGRPANPCDPVHGAEPFIRDGGRQIGHCGLMYHISMIGGGLHSLCEASWLYAPVAGDRGVHGKTVVRNTPLLWPRFILPLGESLGGFLEALIGAISFQIGGCNWGLHVLSDLRVTFSTVPAVSIGRAGFCSGKGSDLRPIHGTRLLVDQWLAVHDARNQFEQGTGTSKGGPEPVR